MKKQPLQTNSIRFALATVLSVLCMASSAFALSNTWTNSPVNSYFATTNNWNGWFVGPTAGAISNAVPGSLNGSGNTPSPETATFTNALVGGIGGASDPIRTDDSPSTGRARNVNSLIFDGINCGPYVITVSNTTVQNNSNGVLWVSHNGSIRINGTVQNSQTILAPLWTILPSSTPGIYNLVNNATNPNVKLMVSSIMHAGATSRATTFILDGTNAAMNTVTNLSEGGGNNTGGIIKQGKGTWIIAGPGTFPTGSSLNVNDGMLVTRDAAAFGSISLANINSNGVLQVDGVSMSTANFTINGNGTYRQNGSGTVNKITVGTGSGVNATLATTGSSDVLTVGALTGAASDGVIHVAGPGTVLLNSDATVTNGTWSFDAGTTQVGSANALGAQPKTLTFGAGSTGKLQLNAFNYTSLALTSNPTAGSPVVENGAAGLSVLTVSNAAANTFAGVLRDGAGGGTLALSKYAIGTLTLSGANTYTGNTTINLGAINITGSLTGSAVTVASGGTLMGNGTVSGLVTIQSGGILAPGSAAVGNLMVSSLTLDAGSIANFEFNTNPTNDQAVVTTSGGLTINGGSINLYQEGTLLAFTTAGTYKLFNYSGVIGGTGVSSLSVGNQQPGYTYTFGTSGGYVTLTIGISTAVLGTWNVDADGNWTDATKWNTNPNIPHSAGDAATFGVGTVLRTVTLNANETVGGIIFTNPNSFVITGGNTLTLDNGGSSTAITTLGGTANAIQTAVTLNDNVTTTVNSGKSLALSGTIGNGVNGSKAVTVAGSGTLSISGNNTYGPAAGSVGTTLNGSGLTVKLGHSSALGAGDVNMNASSTLQANAAAMNVANNLAVAALVDATVDNNGNNLTLSGSISGGGTLTKVGNGTLVLSGGNSYSGNTTVRAGVLSISSESNLGSSPPGESPNNIVLDGGRLLATASLFTGQNRDVGIGPVSGSTGTNAMIDAASGVEFNISSVIASAGNTGVNGLIVNGAAGSTGKVILGGANTFSGQTYIDKGALQIANSLALQNSVLDYTNGTLLFDGSVTAATIGSLAGTQNLMLTNLNNSGVALTLGGNNADCFYGANFSDAGITAGNGSLTKSGTGTLTLAGTNSLSGDIRAQTGTVLILTNGVTVAGSVTSSGSSVPLMQVNGGSLFATNATLCLSQNSGPGNMLLSAGLASFSGTVNVNAGGSESSTSCGITVSTNASLYANTISMGRGGLIATTQPGAGQAGQGLIVNGGTVVVTNNINMGTMAGANSGTSLSVNGGSLTVGGALTFGCNNGGRWSVVDVNGGSLTVPDVGTGIRLGSSTVGAGDVLLVRAGTVTAGIITLGNTNNAATNLESTVVNLTGGSLYLGAGGIVQATTNVVPSITLNGGILGAAADWTCTNGMTLGGATIQAAAANGTAHNITLTGVIGGTGALTKTGTGTLTLASVGNVYSGGVVLNAGTLNINSTWQLGGGVYGGFTFNGGTLQYAATPMNGALDITHDTSVDGTNGVTKLVTLTGNATIDVNGNSITYSNSIGNGGNGGLIVQSSTPGGVLNLRGVNTYLGNTVVSSGTLELATNSIPLYSTVSVASGAVIQLDFAGVNNITNLVLGGVQKAPGTYNSGNSAPYITGTGSLVVASQVNNNPTNITVSVSGSSLTLTWPADHTGWTLQAQTNNLSTGLTPTGWVDVPGSTGVNTTTVTMDPTKPTVFYRLKY